MKKKIIMKTENVSTINFKDVDENKPIFCKRDDKFIESHFIHEKEGWVLKIGSRRSFGPYPTLKKCIEIAISFGNEFYVN